MSKKIDPRWISQDMATDDELLQEIEQLQANIDVEKARIDAILENPQSVGAEAEARIAADNTLQANIDAEEAARIAADDAEAVARTNADNTLQSNIDAEVTARQTLEGDFNTYVSSNDAALAQEVSDRQAADSLLQSDINTEEARALAAEATLQANIDAEVTARQTLEGEYDAYVISNDAALAAEGSARQSADSLLQANIDTEEAARIAADDNLNNIKVNKAGDTMSGSLDFNNNNIDNVNKITEKSIVTTPTYTTVSQDGTLTLTSDSTSVHFLTGTASNFSIVFPDATTLQKGQNFEIYNRTNSAITLKYPDGTLIGVLSTESVSSLILQENSDTNGMYSPFSVEVNQASGISNYNASSVTAFSTNSNAYVEITDFVVIPSPGKYAVWFNCSATSTNNNADNFVCLKKDSVALPDSERQVQSVSSNFVFQMQSLAIIDFNGTEELRVAVKVTTGTLTVNARTGVAIRLGPAS